MSGKLDWRKPRADRLVASTTREVAQWRVEEAVFPYGEKYGGELVVSVWRKDRTYCIAYMLTLPSGLPFYAMERGVAAAVQELLQREDAEIARRFRALKKLAPNESSLTLFNRVLVGLGQKPIDEHEYTEIVALIQEARARGGISC